QYTLSILVNLYDIWKLFNHTLSLHDALPICNTPTPDRNSPLSALSGLIGATVVPFRLPALFASALVLHVIRPSSVFHDHSTTIYALLTSYQTQLSALL